MIAVATAVALSTYELGVLARPTPAAGAGALVVAAAAVGLAPRGARLRTLLVGVVALLVGGVLFPRYAATVATAADQVRFAVGFAVVVFLLSVAAVHAAFRPRGVSPT